MTDQTFAAPINDERSMLIDFLNLYRETLLRKAEGLTDEQARQASVQPSDLNIMGLVRHMTDVERAWFSRYLAGNLDAVPIYYGDGPGEDIDGDLHPTDDDTLEAAIKAFQDEIKISNQIISKHQLDEVVSAYRPGDDRTIMMRWIMIHMIEEYARHCGHADLIREKIDGVTGD